MTLEATTTEETPLRTLSKRLRRVESLIEPAALRPDEDIEHVHRLRVATRRAQAAVDLLRGALPAKLRRDAKKTLREVRRAAGDARDADVHSLAFEAMPDPGNDDERAAIAYTLERLRDDRTGAQGALMALHESGASRAIKQLRRSLRGVDTAPGMEPGRREGPDARSAVAALEDATRADLSDIENLHNVRKRAKGLRYTLEMLGDDGEVGEAIGELRSMQDVLGSLNDLSSMTERLRRYHGEFERGLRQDPRAERGVRALLDRFDNDLRELSESAARTWGSEPGAALIERVREAIGAAAPAPRASTTAPAERALRIRPGSNPNRLAAIDVGTNSIRLMIAELDDDSYRLLDDEKEITRLGAGLAETGRMSVAAIERSVQAVRRMREIADGFGAGRVCAVGTAVARDAANADELCEAMLRETGVELEVISPEREAQLAYRSVSSAFDLSETSAAIVDIGGGSTEVVLCSRGLIEAVYPIPMGAVRLTEMFGGPEECSGPRWGEMRDAIRAEIKRVVGKPPFTPQTMIGTGGTLTTLASVTLHDRRGPLWAQEGSAGVRGLEMQRSEFRHLLERLRKTPVGERARIPGLPADRADIIVAGVAIADLLMKRLGVNELRVHDRGIRDGLLLEMAERARGEAPQHSAGDPMRSVQRFARACRFDHTHCEHVAGLALQMFDQLRAQGDRLLASQRETLTDEARTLLEAAALLQDVGYHINYTRHHKHSHHLILHADLPGFTPRQTRMIANIARYHRRALPKLKHESFAQLDAPDRDIVRAMAAVLRVAGGLDRTHVQRVSSVRVALEGERARFAAEAADDPHVELWGASRKSDLFEQHFGVDVSFEWAPPSPGQGY